MSSTSVEKLNEEFEEESNPFRVSDEEIKQVSEAVRAQDLYLVMASLMMGAVMLIVGNLLADLLLKFVDPRIQLDADG